MARREPTSSGKLRVPASLNRSLSLSKSSLRRKSSYLQDLITRQNHNKGYDREYKEALLNGEVGNGVRTWYSSFTTIGELDLLAACKRNAWQRPARQLGRTWELYRRLTVCPPAILIATLFPLYHQTGSTTNAKRTGASRGSGRVEGYEDS